MEGTMRSLILASILFFSTDSFACPMADAAAFQEAAAKVAAFEGTKATFVLDGMTCGSCSEAVTKTLNEFEGVLVSAVDYQSGKVEIAFDAKKTNITKLESLLATTGYKITEKPS
jgi:copper chaperone CopZ